MNGDRRKISTSLLIRIVGTFLAGWLIVRLLGEQGWQDITQALTEIEPWQLGLAFLLVMISRLLVALRWHVLLRGIDIEIPFSESLRLTFAGLFATNFLPTTVGGDAVRLAGTIQAGYGSAVAAASLVMDRLIGMAGMALFAPFGAARFFAMGGFAVVKNSLAAGSLLERFWKKTKSFTSKLIDTIRIWLKTPRALLLSFLFNLLHMLCFFGLMAVLLDGMGDPMSMWLIAILYSLVYFITLIPISVNGYVLQELSITVIFTNFGGISEHSAASLALLFRFLVMLGSLPGALSLPSLMPKVREQAANPEPPDTDD